MRRCILGIAALYLSACGEPTQGVVSQAYMSLQGTQLQGVQLQGPVADMTMVGFQFAGATLNGAALTNLRVEGGQLVAERNQTTLRGEALRDAHLLAQVRDIDANTSATVEYRITEIEPEDAELYDPTGTGSTFLYTLEQNVGGPDPWRSACNIDNDGRHAAIPLTAIWNEHGDRVESSTLFTLGCTTGVIAKCYRWGYRPWVGGHGNLATMHWTCTRMARADYCGNGKSHTRDGTVINFWDNAPGPEPIRERGPTPLLMLFEAGWSTDGAVCLSHARWLLAGPILALGCPNRLIAPGLLILNATVCDTTAQVFGQSNHARMFDECNLHLNLDLF